MTDLTKPSIEIPKVKPVTTGGGGWPLNISQPEEWAWHRDAFSQEELDTIIQIGLAADLEQGTTVGGIKDHRDSFVSFLYPNEYTSWIYQKLSAVITMTNLKYFGFDLYGLDQGLQFTSYTAPGEHYSWHVDKGSGNRKLSMSMQLSSPNDYKGGNLELWFGGKPIKMSRERGMMAFFPAYTMHRVTPVTSGTRYSLVCWVSGPRFK